MQARAIDLASKAPNEIWRDTGKFFASGRSGAWQDGFTKAQIAAYETRLAELIPNESHRRWIESGTGDV